MQPTTLGCTTLVGAITDENTSARAAHCDKTKGGWGGQFGSSNHNSYFKHVPAMKGRTVGVLTPTLGAELEHSFHYLLMPWGGLDRRLI